MAQAQQDIAANMVAQLRRLDPSMSAEVGTPERKILDTVAQALADAQIDLEGLQSGFDIDSKIGDALDRFLAIFNFGRQKATFAQGFVTFSRIGASIANITIPANTQVQRNTDDIADPHNGVTFYTTASVTLVTPATEIVAPVRAIIAGSSGNIDAGELQIVGSGIPGITAAEFEAGTRGGIDRESDDELKVRFKNTVFRNLAGTRDQYLALAAASQFSVKATVIGPQRLWQEYIQVPPVDDSLFEVIENSLPPVTGNGNVGEYSTALSVIPSAKALWGDLPIFVSLGDLGASSYFFRPDIDFVFNTTADAKNRGDAYRIYTTYHPYSSSIQNPLSSQLVAPSVTFPNVYTGGNDDINAVRPGDILLLEYTYLSSASRNNPALGITNAVDVYVDGGNDQLDSTVMLGPGVTPGIIFDNNPASKYYYENYRRSNEPSMRPALGNFFTPLFREPVTELPEQIIISDNTYTLGTHYWLVKDISELQGSIRARNGIEWSAILKGASSGTPQLINHWTTDPVEIEDYSYDKNIVDLQAAIEGSRQITTDVVAHRAYRRYFKFDITVMYTQGANPTSVNLSIHDAISEFFASQYFGAIIQLSDVLDIIHGITGVDNVRWSSDTPFGADNARVYECDINGIPLLNAWVEDVVIGNGSTPARQRLFIAGQPDPTIVTPGITAGTYNSKLEFMYGVDSSAPVDLYTNISNWAAGIAVVLNAISSIGTLTVTEDTRPTTGVQNPIRSFLIVWSGNGAKNLITPTQITTGGLKGGPTVIFDDFSLGDNELPFLPEVASELSIRDNFDKPFPADTLPGFIIRPRAQNTFIRG